ncbi:trypsin-like peptidase domain-containing protein [Rathayibacter iranicus]|uniref:Serine protease n=2 Tax=Rathayibacter iranicus TaxID=59737 RepID=A0AAD1EN98_9MICO|nr:trypsin-like peptidase domain-containing protein [Rathayibacter iranicus]AZZ56923.1 serine protease [Rathayibacter iranicus]MWV29521.1 serine protease [Rathayibacter iranicus NCPPB 2253 = VKM Ac-1602]PPI42437.1 hypothetical protein C5E09_13185 [Rathayibacter iranicus]PPI57859.1 hypothetical protein C5E08_14085 [Rathayibacter iranicus]PPI68797.1 hypothetical protein C5E01_13140 [Rathayibacter iranicus]
MRSPSAARRTAALFVAICGLATVVTFGPAGPAATAQSLRDQIPIVAGTALEVEGARFCTAGAVLRATGLLSRAWPIANATRYVVMAGHCGTVGETVKVGDAVAGTITWVSSDYDLALVKIPPSTVQRPVCSGASQLHHCSIPPATPRAVGRIILNRGSTQQAVPVPGFGIAGVGEHFCTSGAVSFVNCTFEIASVKSSWLSPGELAAHTTTGFSLQPGDSGGPVANISGRLYGIIISGGEDDHAGVFGYIPMSTIFHDLGYDYELAPA